MKKGDFFQAKFVVKGTELVITPGTSVTGNMTFNFALTTDHAAFASMWEQYRLAGIKVEFRPRINDSQYYYNGSSSTVAPMNYFATTVDTSPNIYNGNTFAFTSLLSRPKLKQTSTFQRHTRFFKPSVMMVAYESGSVGEGSGLTYGVSPKTSPWIDTADTSLSHYGLYYASDTTSITPVDSVVLVPYVTYYVQFRTRIL